jgi:hypothetical protein
MRRPCDELALTILPITHPMTHPIPQDTVVEVHPAVYAAAPEEFKRGYAGFAGRHIVRSVWMWVRCWLVA